MPEVHFKKAMEITVHPLLEEYQIGDLRLKNRIVMASLTRGRATNSDQVPPLMAWYYAQRASAGLILSEGTWVNAKFIGFINVPGIYTQEQVEGRKLVTQNFKETLTQQSRFPAHCRTCSNFNRYAGRSITG